MRNACIALGNINLAGLSGLTATRERILVLLSRFAASEDQVIAESAQWAIVRIQESDGRRDPPVGSFTIAELAQSLTIAPGE